MLRRAGSPGAAERWSPEHCREVHTQGRETEFRIQLARMRFCLPVPRNHSRPLPQLALSRARGAPRAAPVAVCAGEEGLAVRDGTVSFAIELAPKLRADTRARTSWAAPLARAGRRARRGGGGEDEIGLLRRTFSGCLLPPQRDHRIHARCAQRRLERCHRRHRGHHPARDQQCCRVVRRYPVQTLLQCMARHKGQGPT